MRRIVSSINVTPDGFCNHGQVVADKALHHYAVDLVNNSSAVLFGRVTYQLFEQYWPEIAKNKTGQPAIDAFAGAIDRVEKIVFSHSLNAVSWHNSRIINGHVADELKGLKERSSGDLLILGSPGLVASLSGNGLIDEYQFVIQPLLGGSGKRLFDTLQLKESLGLKLVENRSFTSGATLLRYAVDKKSSQLN